MSKQDKHTNPFPEEQHTGHIWDDNLRELDNEPPKWWSWGLVASVLFVIGYFVIYPSIPLLSSYTKGVVGYSSIKEMRAQQDELEKSHKTIISLREQALRNKSIKEVYLDAGLVRYAMTESEELFGDNCAGCHSPQAVGNAYFPSLRDDDWLWGNSIEQIYHTIRDGRRGNMPARGLSGNLTDAEIDAVVEYVVALSIGTGGIDAYQAGRDAYAKGQCMVCHGAQGLPIAPIGAANLSDSIWRFSDGDDLKAALRRTITFGVNQPNEQSRKAIMPSFKGVLSDSEIKRLAIYVSQLSRRQDFVH